MIFLFLSWMTISSLEIILCQSRRFQLYLSHIYYLFNACNFSKCSWDYLLWFKIISRSFYKLRMRVYMCFILDAWNVFQTPHTYQTYFIHFSIFIQISKKKTNFQRINIFLNHKNMFCIYIHIFITKQHKISSQIPFI